MFNISDIIIFSVTILYVLLMSQLFIGWITISPFKYSYNDKPNIKLSVVIPARNEESNILKCLNALLYQNYPTALYEIIIVDDNSGDNTGLIVLDFISKNPSISVKFISLDKCNIRASFKKNAINYAVKEAKGDLIITTDADCIMKPDWLLCIASFYSKTNSAFISSPVCYSTERNIFEKLQSVEFLSLVYSGASLISLGLPVMCNGANLAFEKKVFEEVSGFDSDIRYASGDDVFLMLKIHKKYPKRLSFLKSSDAMIYTKASENLKTFIQQRKRWVSKSSGYRTATPIIVALIVFLFNALICTLFVTAFFVNQLWTIVLVLFTIKLLFDLPAIIAILRFGKKVRLLSLYIPLQVLYPFYITLIGISGNIGGYQWKGRRVK